MGGNTGKSFRVTGKSALTSQAIRFSYGKTLHFMLQLRSYMQLLLLPPLLLLLLVKNEIF